MRNNKNNKGVAIIEFAIVSIILLGIIFSTLGLGIDAYHRFVAGEKSENVLKDAENASEILQLLSEGKMTPKQMCKSDGMCGFDIPKASNCDVILKWSYKTACEDDKVCDFWFELYKIARKHEGKNKEGKGYLYGKVGGNIECRSTFAVLFPGFDTTEIKDDSNRWRNIPCL